jgi:cellulose synthase/poly-beta-1,6-N-acetylglucosamine synthase-like glycosyltransferase
MIRRTLKITSDYARVALGVITVTGILLALVSFIRSRPTQVAYVRSVNQSFQHLYSPNSFDLMLLIPYFLLLIALGLYGQHKYELVYMYYRNRQNRTADPPGSFPELPSVSVQLPIFNEQYVVDQLVESICKLEYPEDKLEIQVLDDSTDETVDVARAVVERYAALGHPITYIHRTNREGFKAGALQTGLTISRGEFIAIFDADFVPPEDWLLRVVNHFVDPRIGMVQTRWTHLNRDYSFVTEAEAILLDGHFVIEQGGRSRSNLFFNFDGAAGMWRRKAIEDAGGWESDTLAENVDLSYRAQLKGWKFKYVENIECPAQLPSEFAALRIQRARRAKGMIQTSKKILPLVLRSSLSWRVKKEAFYHLTANITSPLLLVLSTLLLPALIIRSFRSPLQLFLIDLPLFLAMLFSSGAFYLAAEKELSPRNWTRAFLYVPIMLVLSLGFTLTDTRAVLEGLLGVRSPFMRTPKYRVHEKASDRWRQKYRRRLGIIPWLEILVACYFCLMCLYAFGSGNYLTTLVLIPFPLGYFLTGLYSLLQGRGQSQPDGREVHSKVFAVRT